MLFALLLMPSHRHWLKSLAKESSTVSNLPGYFAHHFSPLVPSTDSGTHFSPRVRATPFRHVYPFVAVSGAGPQPQQRRRKRQVDQEQRGARIFSDVDFMITNEGSIPTAMKCSRSGRITATALSSKGVTEFGVELFSGNTEKSGIKRLHQFQSAAQVSKDEPKDNMWHLAWAASFRHHHDNTRRPQEKAENTEHTPEDGQEQRTNPEKKKQPEKAGTHQTTRRKHHRRGQTQNGILAGQAVGTNRHRRSDRPTNQRTDQRTNERTNQQQRVVCVVHGSFFFSNGNEGFFE